MLIKVLMVSKTLALGGVSNVIFSYYKEMKDDERVLVDFAAGEPIEERYRKLICMNGSNLFLLKERDSNIPKFIFDLSQIIKKGNYDIVHVHGNSSLVFPELLAARLAGVKVRIAHSHSTSCDHPKLEKRVRWLFDLLYTDAVACGEASGQWMFRKNDFIILKNGINLNDYKFSEEIRDNVRTQLGVNECFVIGHVGSFNYIKNHEYLLDVFSEVTKVRDDAVLLLVGDGELMPLIKEKANFLGLSEKVIFYGTSDDVKSLMLAMDVFVLPSKFEGLPCVLVEAQAMGLPCVVSSAVSEEAKMSENYFVSDIKKENLVDWKTHILKSFDVDKKQVREKNRKLLKEFGYEITEQTQRLVGLYTALVDKRK